jgi:urease accessory protein
MPRHIFCNLILSVADPTPTLDDHVDLEWWDLQRRALRKTTRAGQDVRILLPLGVSLFDGAIFTNESRAALIQVHLRESEVFIIHPRSETELANLALELGNLHSPAEFSQGSIRTVIDGPVEALLANMQVPFERQTVKFNPRRCEAMPEIRVSADFRVTSS